MNASALERRFILSLSIVSFILSIASLTFVHFRLRMPVETALVVAVLVYFAVHSVVVLDAILDLHGRILAPIRKFALGILHGVVLDTWNVNVQIEKSGDATISHDVKGKVNFGSVRWIPMGIISYETDQSNLRVQAVDLTANLLLKTEFIMDYPKYKRVRIRFDRRLHRGDKFHIRVKYKLYRTFFFGQTDFYTHEAKHNTKRLNIRVAFPHGVKVGEIWGEIQTQYGDVLGKRETVRRVSTQLIAWDIQRVAAGNNYKLLWVT